MKYLSTYKIFELFYGDKVNHHEIGWKELEAIKQIIDDVLDDIRDDGFGCYCNIGFGQHPSVEIRIYKKNKDLKYGERSFEFSDVENTMRRIYSILSEYSKNVVFTFVKDLEEEFEYPISKYGFGILKSEFSEYFSTQDDGFMIDFELR